jgi:hypothetical protein
MARGATSRLSTITPLTSTVSMMFWATVKIVVSVIMLALAAAHHPRPALAGDARDPRRLHADLRLRIALAWPRQPLVPTLSESTRDPWPPQLSTPRPRVNTSFTT